MPIDQGWEGGRDFNWDEDSTSEPCSTCSVYAPCECDGDETVAIDRESMAALVGVAS